MTLNTLLVLYFLCLLVVIGTTNRETSQQFISDDEDYVPIIGILANAANLRVRKYGSEFVRSEFVRFLQLGGADVVILESVKGSKHSFSKLFNKINGVFLPGGGTSLEYSAFAKAAGPLIDKAMEVNDAGGFFPIWGTCLGMQFMVTKAAGRMVMDVTDSRNFSVPLTLSPSYKESVMMNQIPAHVIKYLSEENITANFHKYSLLVKTYNETESINRFYRVLSTNMDRNGLEFVSTIEAYNYPFYGVQWHPEKPIFIKDPALDISHSSHAIQMEQHFANFFVDQARKNHHRVTEEERSEMVLEYNISSYCLPRSALHDMCGACRCCITPPNTWSVVIVTATVTAMICLLLSFLCSLWPVVSATLEIAFRTVVLNRGSWYPLGIPEALAGGTKHAWGIRARKREIEEKR